jgi:hypothetical protein
MPSPLLALFSTPHTRPDFFPARQSDNPNSSWYISKNQKNDGLMKPPSPIRG